MAARHDSGSSGANPGERPTLSVGTDRRYKRPPRSCNRECGLPTDMTMKSITSSLAALVLVALTPGIAPGQSAGSSAYVDDRLNQISRSIADLQGRMEQLRKQNQQLQQSLDKMRSSYESRLTRLEKGGATKAPTPRSGQSHR